MIRVLPAVGVAEKIMHIVFMLKIVIEKNLTFLILKFARVFSIHIRGTLVGNTKPYFEKPNLDITDLKFSSRATRSFVLENYNCKNLNYIHALFLRGT